MAVKVKAKAQTQYFWTVFHSSKGRSIILLSFCTRQLILVRWAKATTTKTNTNESFRSHRTDVVKIFCVKQKIKNKNTLLRECVLNEKHSCNCVCSQVLYGSFEVEDKYLSHYKTCLSTRT